MASNGFIRVEVGQRRRGRPDQRRRVVVELKNGTRLGFAPDSPPAVERAVIEAVLGLRYPRC